MKCRLPCFYGWVVVATAALGLLFGAFPIVTFSFGVFLKPYMQEFHADRAAISLAFTIHNVIAAILAVFIGGLADRVGARQLIVAGLTFLALIMFSAQAIGSDLWQLYIFYSALGVVAGATTSVPYTLVVSRWFTRRRGLALGLMMTGLGAGAALMPPMVQRLIAGYGWRTTFTIVGCAILIIPMPVVALFLKENPRRLGLLPDGGFDTVLAPWRPEGFTWRKIRRCPALWLIIVAFGLMSVSVHACVVYLPEILGGPGASADAAALGSSVAGLAVLAGRIGTGYFLDRYFGPYVALIVFANSAFGIALLLWTGGAGPAALLGAFLVGLGFGAEVDLIAYLMGRYFGLRSLGTAFGFGFGVFVLAGGFGPLIMGFAFEKTGSYLRPLTGFLLATGLAAAMVGNLGPYNFGVNEEAKTPPITGPEVNT